MTNYNHENNSTRISKLANDAVIPNPVTPQSKLTASKRLSKGPGISRLSDAVFHVRDDFASD